MRSYPSHSNSGRYFKKDPDRNHMIGKIDVPYGISFVMLLFYVLRF